MRAVDPTETVRRLLGKTSAYLPVSADGRMVLRAVHTPVIKAIGGPCDPQH